MKGVFKCIRTKVKNMIRNNGNLISQKKSIKESKNQPLEIPLIKHTVC